MGKRNTRSSLVETLEVRQYFVQFVDLLALARNYGWTPPPERDLVTPAYERYKPYALFNYVRRPLLSTSGVTLSDHVELWRTDGTTQGTFALASNVALYGFNRSDRRYSYDDVDPRNPSYLATTNGRLFLRTSDGVYVTDGSAAGTVKYADSAILDDRWATSNGALFARYDRNQVYSFQHQRVITRFSGDSSIDDLRAIGGSIFTTRITKRSAELVDFQVYRLDPNVRSGVRLVDTITLGGAHAGTVVEATLLSGPAGRVELLVLHRDTYSRWHVNGTGVGALLQTKIGIDAAQKLMPTLPPKAWQTDVGAEARGAYLQVNGARDLPVVYPVDLPDPAHANVHVRFFNDVNRDGRRQKGEAFLPGYRAVWDVNGNGLAEKRELTIRSNAEGVSTFAGVVDAALNLVALPSDALDQFTAGSTRRAVVGTTGSTIVDFGLVPASVQGVLTGKLYEDFNRNGKRDKYDYAIAGARVYLDRDADGVLDKSEPFSRTDADGVYRLEGLGDGSSVLRVSGIPEADRYRSLAPVAYVRSSTTSHDLPVNSDRGQASVAATFFSDRNRNGIRDADEPTSGTKFAVTWQLNNLTTGERGVTASTSPRTSLSAGRYEALVYNTTQGHAELEPFERFTFDVNPNVALSLSLPLRLSTLHGTVFDDLDRDGVRDAGEGLVVSLPLRLSFDVTGTQWGTTDSAGRFTLTDLAPGDYDVRFYADKLVGYTSVRPKYNSTQTQTMPMVRV